MEELDDYSILEDNKKINVKFILVDNYFGEKSIEKYINKKIEIENNNIDKENLRSFLLYNTKNIDCDNNYVIKYILKFSFREEINKLCNDINDNDNLNNKIKLKIIKEIDDIELIDEKDINHITINSLIVVLEKKEKKIYIKQKINNKKNITKKCKN